MIKTCSKVGDSAFLSSNLRDESELVAWKGGGEERERDGGREVGGN